jgi:DNA-binding NtrC family response regulator
LNARIIATIDRNYNAIITEGNVRSDLVSNLGILTVQVPSLREHNEDIPELLNFYVDKFVDEEELKYRKFDVAAQNRLRNYPWPGNLRELKNLVQKLLASGKESEITLEEIENEIESSIYKNDAFVDKDMLSLPLREAREQFERSYLQQQLILCDGKVGKLASRVGMERTHLYRKLKSLNIEFGFRSGKNEK